MTAGPVAACGIRSVYGVASVGVAAGHVEMTGRLSVPAWTAVSNGLRRIQICDTASFFFVGLRCGTDDDARVVVQMLQNVIDIAADLGSENRVAVVGDGQGQIWAERVGALVETAQIEL